MGIFMGVSALFFKDSTGQNQICLCILRILLTFTLSFRPVSIFLGWPGNLLILGLSALLIAPLACCRRLPVCVVAGGALIDPCAASFASDKAPQGMSGIFLGTYQAAASMGSFLGPVLGGFLYEYTQTAPYYMASVASLLCAPSVLALFRLQEALEKGQSSPSQPLMGDEEEPEQPIERLLSQAEASPMRKRAIDRAAYGLRSFAGAGTLLSLFQLPNDPELTCRTLRQKDRITDERLEWKVRSKTEVFSPSKLARSNTLERMLLRQYSMQASDKCCAQH
ncbi:unnamed protein product [Cladocopium goreaui]|uniref:Major facilitator superfamily (MFS) profile domain-containing protein n=1 Tax=Cladocopium goreaui TaxID=2562237 RepID=A0A9P1CEH4_9DINO|nr:unnamed protein product [Cladocopium goreaui]